MALSRDQIAARLKDIRQRIGFTQAQVAAQLKLHRPTISEIEAGRRAVTAEELFQLASLYGTSVGEILNEQNPPASRASELLALRSDDPAAASTRVAIERFISDRRSETELEEMLQVADIAPARRHFDFPEPVSVMFAIRQGETLAEQERQSLGLGAEPVRNVLPLLAQQGVRIGPIRTLDNENIDGLYFESEDLGACIGINWRSSDWTGGRAAFTAAHEYAHCLLRDRQREFFTFSTPDADLKEVRANAFAAAFLMPKTGVEGYFRQMGLAVEGTIDHLAPGDVVRAMDFFGVSRPALLFRLVNLQLIAEEMKQALATFRIKDVAKVLGLTFRDREYLGTRLPQLAIHAWRQGLITTGRAADLCGIELSEFNERMRQLGETPPEYDLPLAAAAS